MSARFGLIDDKAMVRRPARSWPGWAWTSTPSRGAELPPVLELTEIAKALALNATVLIMDEPTASLTKTESEALFALIERSGQWVSIVYISHRDGGDLPDLRPDHHSHGRPA